MNKHCCETMNRQLEGASKGLQFDDTDWLVNYIPKFDEYGIVIHDGGCAHNVINFCPWCGTKLPESRRDEWFDKLEGMGFTEPTEQEIPEEFNTDAWFREDHN